MEVTQKLFSCQDQELHILLNRQVRSWQVGLAAANCSICCEMGGTIDASERSSAQSQQPMLALPSAITREGHC